MSYNRVLKPKDKSLRPTTKTQRGCDMTVVCVVIAVVVLYALGAVMG